MFLQDIIIPGDKDIASVAFGCGKAHSTFIQRRPILILGTTPTWGGNQLFRDTIVRAGKRPFQRFGRHRLYRTLAHRLLAPFGRRCCWIWSVAPLGKCRALVSGNMIGFVAFDLILRRVGARVVSVALIVEVMRVDPNDRAADAPGLRVPTELDLQFCTVQSLGFPRAFRLRASFGLAFGIIAKADLIERLAVLGGLH